MKLLLIPIILISFSLSAQDYSGHIIKLKNKGELFFNSFSQIGSFRKLRIRNHHFYKLTDNNLTKQDVERLASHPDVEYIEPDYYYDFVKPVEISWGREITEKNGFKKQWNLYNRGKKQRGRGLSYTEGKDISALKAWETTQGNNEVIIAVIDTGVDYDHPDLKENVWINEAEKNGEIGVDDDLNGYIDDVYGWDFAKNISDPIDNEWGHGTHVAGIIAASHNERGIKGVMNNAKIMALKIFNKKAEGEDRSPTSGIIESFYYAIENDVKVINASWGGGAYSKALEMALKDLAKNNIIFVTTAGNHKRNNDETPYYPGGYDSDNIVVVGAYDGDGAKSWYSGYGKEMV
ncbi:MAG: S8 family serine peptidase, partial [Bdellovibrionales bacterium]|nr:S8 family serine peptidase [Bdellovibrionales bacterium]